MEQQLIVLKGLPASGKSTWAMQWAEKDPTGRVIISRDGLRHMLGKYWVQERESLVSIMEHNNICSALQMGYSVVIDSTGFRWTKEQEEAYSKIVSGLDIIIVDFTSIPIETCLERNKKRAEPVHEDVIKGMAKKYLNYEESKLV